MAMVCQCVGILTVNVIVFLRSPGVFHSQDSFPLDISSPVVGDIFRSGRCRCVRCRGLQRTVSSSGPKKRTGGGVSSAKHDDDVLHAVSIPAYETHRWKEDSCFPNLDGGGWTHPSRLLLIYVVNAYCCYVIGQHLDNWNLIGRFLYHCFLWSEVLLCTFLMQDTKFYVFLSLLPSS